LRPIPINRRWLANQPAAQEPQADSVAMRPPSAPQYSSLSPEARAQRREAILGRTLYARYQQACLGCGTPIEVGDPVTLHPEWDVLVHDHCRHCTEIAPRIVSYAKSQWVCRRCLRLVQPGDRIVREGDQPWVHLECAR
jgi:hypothetical protein